MNTVVSTAASWSSMKQYRHMPLLYTSVKFIHVHCTEMRRFQVKKMTEVFFVTNVG